MKKLNISLFTFAICVNVYSQKMTDPYRLVSSDYKTQGEEIVIKNMPKVRSQDSVGLCYAFSSATLLQKFWCDDLKVADCAGLGPEETISPVVLTGNAKPLNGESEVTHLVKSTDAGNGADPGNLLKNATIKHSFCAESNFPFDQFVGMNNFNNMDKLSAAKEMEKLANAKILSLENTYKKYKTEATSTETCTECLKEISAVSPLNIDHRSKLVQRAFRKDTFQEFLFNSFFIGCNPKVKLTTPIYGDYPATDIEIDTKQYLADPNHPIKVSYLNQIKKVLSNKVPLQTAFCGLKVVGDDKKCAGNHAAVISGSKTVCKSSGQCVEMLKLQNSYGTEWQEKYNDGWVVANDILNSIIGIAEIQKIQRGSLSWITDGPLK